MRLRRGLEKMVRIVESGKPFSAENIEWLNTLLSHLEKSFTNPGQPQAAAPAPVLQPAASKPATSPAPVPQVGAAVEMELNLNIADDADLLREFITESREHLDNIEHGVLVLENQPADAETLNTVFRAFHTFKGGAGFLNLVPINRLAHMLESLLDLARQGRLAITPPVIELILRGRDVLKQFLEQIEGASHRHHTGRRRFKFPPCQGRKCRRPSQMLVPANPPETENAKAFSPRPDKSAPAAHTTSPVAENGPPRRRHQPAAATARDGQSAMVKVDTTKLDGLLDLVGEMVIAQSLVGRIWRRWRTAIRSSRATWRSRAHHQGTPAREHVTAHGAHPRLVPENGARDPRPQRQAA